MSNEPTGAPGARTEQQPTRQSSEPGGPPPERSAKRFLDLDSKKAVFSFNMKKGGNVYETPDIRGYLGDVFLVWNPGHKSPEGPHKDVPERWELRIDLRNLKYGDGKRFGDLDLGSGEQAVIIDAELQIGSRVPFESFCRQIVKVPRRAFLGIVLKKEGDACFPNLAIWDVDHWEHVWGDKYPGETDDDGRLNDEQKEAKNAYFVELVKTAPAYNADRLGTKQGRNQQGSSAGTERSSASGGFSSAGSASAGGSVQASANEGDMRPTAFGHTFFQWPELEAWQVGPTDKQIDSLKSYCTDKSVNYGSDVLLEALANELKIDKERRSTKGHWRMVVEIVRDGSPITLKKLRSACEYDPFADE